MKKQIVDTSEIIDNFLTRKTFNDGDLIIIKRGELRNYIEEVVAEYNATNQRLLKRLKLKTS